MILLSFFKGFAPGAMGTPYERAGWAGALLRMEIIARTLQ
jgi:hypothetical protein